MIQEDKFDCVFYLIEFPHLTRRPIGERILKFGDLPARRLLFLCRPRVLHDMGCGGGRHFSSDSLLELLCKSWRSQVLVLLSNFACICHVQQLGYLVCFFFQASLKRLVCQITASTSHGVEPMSCCVFHMWIWKLLKYKEDRVVKANNARQHWFIGRSNRVEKEDAIRD